MEKKVTCGTKGDLVSEWKQSMKSVSKCRATQIQKGKRLQPLSLNYNYLELISKNAMRIPDDYRISIYSPASALFILLTAQNFPHILQVSLWSSSGFLLSRIAFAVSGSRAHSNCASQSRTRRASAILSSMSLAPGIPLAISAA